MSPTYEFGSTKISTGKLVVGDNQPANHWGAVVERTNGGIKNIILLDKNTPYNKEIGSPFQDEDDVLWIVSRIINIPIDDIQRQKTSDDPSELSLADHCRERIHSSSS